VRDARLSLLGLHETGDERFKVSVGPQTWRSV
jgi:hypothetical protein